MYIVAQLGNTDVFSGILWFVVLMVFFMFYPRIMISQIMWKLERSAVNMENQARDAKKFVIRSINKKPTKEQVESINRFFEFFAISPVDLDPNGIIKKFDHMIRDQKRRFTHFVNQIAPKKNSEEKANLEMGFAAGISLYTVAKIVRHYVELVKKTKNLQIAMILQMQLPMIEKIVDALSKGTESLTRGEPIGDSLGPLVAANLIGNNKVKEIDDETVMTKTKIKGREVFVTKAKGPGGRLGFQGRAFQDLVKKEKIAKIITIDAAAKLEGEKTGSVAEGIGVAMGGIGVERYYIEEVAVNNNIPIDSVIVKMSQEEAITPMRKAIKDAVPEVMKSIDRSLSTLKQKEKAIIIGVGNTSGVGNSLKAAKEAEKWVDKNEKKIKAKKKGKKEE